jgi:hypothetical protein
MAGGWHPDPAGRADQRYWDGERWTEHVMRGGESGIDHLGSPPSSGLRRALDALGPDARERPAPDLLGALTAGGAALVALGVLALVAGDDGNRPGLLGGSALLVAAGYVAAAFGGKRLRPAAVTLAAIGIVVFVIFAFEGSIEDNKWAWPLILLAAAAGVMYIAPILRGRPLLGGISLVALVGWVAFLAAQGDIDRARDASTTDVGEVGSSVAQGAYAVLLIAGVALLVAAFLLDHANYHGLATVFIAVAAVSVLAGAAGVASELGDAGGAVLVGIAGLALAIVGYLGRRRFTTWLGALVVPYALVAIAISIKDERVPGATLLVVFGAAVVAVCFCLPIVWRARARSRTKPTTAS